MDGFNFTQSTPSTIWTVNHNLNNSNPNVEVFMTYLGVFQKVIPLNVVSNSANTVTVTFTQAQTGSVRITS